MAAQVITVAQQKGGAGKTTMAAHLAIAWSGAGKTVAIVDIDPQASLATWFAMREASLSKTDARAAVTAALTHHAIAGWRVAARVGELARDHDIVLIDSPPHADTEARFAVRAADLVLIPVQPSPMDIWASQATIALAKAEQTKALVVLNRVPARAKLTEVMRDAIKRFDVTLAKSQIGNRVALASAMVGGFGVTEAHPRSTAAAEIKALAQEVLKAAR